MIKKDFRNFNQNMPQQMICELHGKLAHMKLNVQIEIEFHERNVIWQKFDMLMGQGWSKAIHCTYKECNPRDYSKFPWEIKSIHKS